MSVWKNYKKKKFDDSIQKVSVYLLVMSLTLRLILLNKDESNIHTDLDYVPTFVNQSHTKNIFSLLTASLNVDNVTKQTNLTQYRRF